MRRWSFPACVWATFILLACGVPGFAVAGSSEDLIQAIGVGDLPRVQKLLEEGASPDSRDEKGIPALALAAQAKNNALVQALLDKGADVNATTENAAEGLRDTPVVVQVAVDGSAETLRLILRAGANPNAHNGEGLTPLMVAAYLGNTELIPVLVDAKANLEAREPSGQNALMFAAEGGRYEAARLLLDAGAEVNALGEQKATPLMYASQHGYDDVVALLVERGADVSRRADSGLTALDFARQNDQQLTVWLLESGGRQLPPRLEFQNLRPLLYQENPFEAFFLDDVQEDKTFEAARQLALKGELQKARDILEAGREELQGQGLYWWALVHLQMQLDDRKAALASLRKILATPKLGTRETLRAWKLVRGLGETPPPDLSKQVLGVVVESGTGPSVLVVAAYADGLPRYFGSLGGGVIGDTWTPEETQKVHEIVGLAQEVMDGMAPTEDLALPKPGRVRITILTPGGSYGAEESFAFLSLGQGRFGKVFAASDQLFGMLYKHYEAEASKEKPSPVPPS